MGFLTLVIKSWMKNSVKHELEFEQFFIYQRHLRVAQVVRLVLGVVLLVRSLGALMVLLDVEV